MAKTGMMVLVSWVGWSNILIWLISYHRNYSPLIVLNITLVMFLWFFLNIGLAMWFEHEV